MTGSDPERVNFTNPAQPRRVKIDVYKKIPQSPHRAKNDIHAGCYRKGTVLTLCEHTHAHTRTRTRTHTHTHARARTHTHAHTHIHTRIHANTHTHALTGGRVLSPRVEI